MRHFLPAAILLLTVLASFADNAQTVKDCEYWRLGADDAEKARRRAACDTVIANKRFAAKDRAMAYAQRASYADSDQRPKDAIADLSEAIALDPEQIEWVRDRGFLYHFQPDHARALQDFNTYLAAKPENAHVTFYRGLTYLELGDEVRGFADMARPSSSTRTMPSSATGGACCTPSAAISMRRWKISPRPSAWIRPTMTPTCCGRNSTSRRGTTISPSRT